MHFLNEALFFILVPMKANQIALITGGNRGLGLQTARELARLGIRTIVGARDLEKGAYAAALLQTEGLDAEAVHLDVADPLTHTEVYSYLESHHGKLDILGNRTLEDAFRDLLRT